MSRTLEIGDDAPDFTLPRDGGETVTLSGLRPNIVVLFFYPRDDTPGCTIEANDFTARRADFEAAGATILGISKDSVQMHEKFIAKHDLGIALVSDRDGDVCEQFGTWVEKNRFGKTSMGVERATYLVDRDGKIARIWRKVKVPGHVDEVLDAVKALG